MERGASSEPGWEGGACGAADAPRARSDSGGHRWCAAREKEVRDALVRELQSEAEAKTGEKGGKRGEAGEASSATRALASPQNACAPPRSALQGPRQSCRISASAGSASRAATHGKSGAACSCAFIRAPDNAARGHAQYRGGAIRMYPFHTLSALTCRPRGPPWCPTRFCPRRPGA